MTAMTDRMYFLGTFSRDGHLMLVSPGAGRVHLHGLARVRLLGLLRARLVHRCLRSADMQLPPLGSATTARMALLSATSLIIRHGGSWSDDELC